MKTFVISSVLALTFISTTANAGEFSGNEPLICASSHTFECSPGQECVWGTADSIDAPSFFKFDFKQKTIETVKPAKKRKESKIHNIQRTDNEVIVQGVENDLGWSLSISRETGKMLITAARENTAFVIFGACTAYLQ